MQALKKAIPAALVLAFAGAAQAQVSLYGVIDWSYGKNEFLGDEKATLHSGGDQSNSQGNSTTRFGIKGSTDVGSGVKANFKMESGGITSDGSVNGNFFNRQMWFGMSGGFGEVRLGRQDSVPFQVMGNFDFNGQSNGVTSAYSGIGVWNTGRQSRTIQYISPEMSGFKAHVGFQPKDANNTSGLAPTPAAGDDEEAVYSGAATYTAGGLAVGASFETERFKDGADFKSVAASYDFKVVKVMAGFTSVGEDNSVTNGPNVKHSGPSFGIVAPVAGFSVGAHYAKDTKADKDAVVELFINKEVLKNTYGYIEYAKSSSDVAARDGLSSAAVGVIYVF